MRRRLFIIPAFNEEKNITKVIRGISELCPGADILVVDDGSEDLTVSAAESAGAKVIALPFNSGYGVALQTAYKYAVAHKFDYAIQLDADGQHDVASIPNLIRGFENNAADIVIGSRFLDGGGYHAGFSRWLGIQLFSLILLLVIRQKITDPTSGFRVLNSKALELYSHDFPSDFPDADLLVFSGFHGLSIKEVPVVMRQSPSNKHSMHTFISHPYYIFKMLLSILVLLLQYQPKRRE